MNILFICFSFFMLLFFSKQCFTQSSFISITYPNGGEKIYNGDTLLIKWDAHEFDGDLDIFLWDGIKKEYTEIASDVSSSLKVFPVAIPRDLSGNSFRIKLRSSNSGIVNMSKAFFTISDDPNISTKNRLPDFKDVDELINTYREEKLTVKLGQNYPNPFNFMTELKYFISKQEKIKLALYNTEGREVALLLDKYVPGGWHSLIVNGSGLTCGTYLLMLESNGIRSMTKILKTD